MTPVVYSVLSLLEREPGMRVNRLTTLLALKPANCTTLINELERDGLVAREKLRASGNPLVDRHLAELRARLGEADLAELSRLLHKLFY